jgi:plasmid stabilization system protein ParE
MRVRYTPRAFADREAVFAYLDRRNPQAARNLKSYIKERINELGHFPKRYKFIEEIGAHALWLGRYPYVVIIVCAMMRFSSSTFDTLLSGNGRETVSSTASEAV